MSAPGNTDRRSGGPGERAGYVTHEEQLRALVAHMRRRDRRLARAIVAAMSAPPGTLGAFGEIARFIVNQARCEGRRQGRAGGGAR